MICRYCPHTETTNIWANITWSLWTPSFLHLVQSSQFFLSGGCSSGGRQQNRVLPSFWMPRFPKASLRSRNLAPHGKWQGLNGLWRVEIRSPTPPKTHCEHLPKISKHTRTPVWFPTVACLETRCEQFSRDSVTKGRPRRITTNARGTISALTTAFGEGLKMQPLSYLQTPKGSSERLPLWLEPPTAHRLAPSHHPLAP